VIVTMDAGGGNSVNDSFTAIPNSPLTDASCENSAMRTRLWTRSMINMPPTDVSAPKSRVRLPGDGVASPISSMAMVDDVVRSCGGAIAETFGSPCRLIE